MKVRALLLISCLGLLSVVAARADRGDFFLTTALAADAAHSKSTPFGGELGLQMGVNDKTDFQAMVDWTATSDYFDDKGRMETRVLVRRFGRIGVPARLWRARRALSQLGASPAGAMAILGFPPPLHGSPPQPDFRGQRRVFGPGQTGIAVPALQIKTKPPLGASRNTRLPGGFSLLRGRTGPTTRD
jgi:hypothetical protein